MNKKDLIRINAEKIAREMKISSSKATKLSTDVVSIFFKEIKKAVCNGEKVGIRGFGTFSGKTYKSYTGRNPKTGESVDVPKKQLPVFKTSPSFVEWINDKLGTPLKDKK